jgi:enolase-phosphatase E1
VPFVEGPEIRVILLDIEGTTTPIEFVHRTLFSYARQNLSAFLQKSFGEPEVRTCVADLKAQHALDRKAAQNPPEWRSDTQKPEIEAAVQYGIWLMDRDSKIGPLKALQGMIWQEGYRSGMLRGQIFPDVPAAFDRWRQQGKDISIYSSGSTLAQEMLFRTTEFGDLAAKIKAFFDTRVGAKSNTESYKKIASVAGQPENQFLFFSDTIAELDAARSAGMQTALVVRSSKADVSSTKHAAIKSFDELA